MLIKPNLHAGKSYDKLYSMLNSTMDIINNRIESNQNKLNKGEKYGY